MAHREKFVTEKLIVQIFGLIKNNMIDIEGKRFENTPKERKLFYQVNIIKQLKNLVSIKHSHEEWNVLCEHITISYFFLDIS